MKKILKRLFKPAVISCSLLGIFVLCCGFPGCQTSPPTKMEQGMFDIVTNTVVVVKTNMVTLTNTEVVQITVTNVDHTTKVTDVTNYTQVVVPVQVTNKTETYDYGAPSARTQAQKEMVTSIVGTGANMVAPGSGELVKTVTTGLITGGLALWAWIRGNGHKNAAAQLTQVVETGREIIKAVPGGEKYDAAYLQWMKDHQTETGVANLIGKLVEKNVSNDQAKGAVQSIMDVIGTVSDVTPKAPAKV